MPVYRDDAVVLRTHKLGEADRIVTLLTRRHGKVRAVARGVRRTASKFGSRLEPFMVADLQLYEGRTLDVITQAETIGAYGAEISQDYPRTRPRTRWSRPPTGSPRPRAHSSSTCCSSARFARSRHEHGAALTLEPTCCALAIAGVGAELADCARCGREGPHTAVVVQVGGVVCEECAPPGTPRIAASTVGLLGALLAGDWDVAEAAPDRDRAQASGIVAAYAQWHLERGLRSLSHVSRETAEQ